MTNINYSFENPKQVHGKEDLHDVFIMAQLHKATDSKHLTKKVFKDFCERYDIKDPRKYTRKVKTWNSKGWAKMEKDGYRLVSNSKLTNNHPHLKKLLRTIHPIYSSYKKFEEEWYGILLQDKLKQLNYAQRRHGIKGSGKPHKISDKTFCDESKNPSVTLSTRQLAKSWGISVGSVNDLLKRLKKNSTRIGIEKLDDIQITQCSYNDFLKYKKEHPGHFYFIEAFCDEKGNSYGVVYQRPRLNIFIPSVKSMPSWWRGGERPVKDGYEIMA